MELDDLKQLWNEQTKQEFKPSDNSLMELLHNKNYGPVAALKNKFKIQLLTLPVLIAILIVDFIEKPDMLHNIILCFFIAFVLCLKVYFGFNYTIINRLQNTNISVKQIIEKNIIILENGFKKYLVITRGGILIFFIILLEILMHFHSSPDFESWYSYSVFIRVSVYILLFVVNYFLGKYFFEKQFGQHISYLRELLNKMD